MTQIFIFLILLFQILKSISCTSATANVNSQLCPNFCSGRGTCNNNGTRGMCSCFPGFIGGDCSLRVCPAAQAWVDYPSATDTAHANFTECSNMGICDRSTGICSCRSGFGGAACDKMLCPIGKISNDYVAYTKLDISSLTQPCSGRGRCMSLREISEYEDYDTNLMYTTYTGWDMDMIHGCVCETGWEGVACQKRSCPKGNDPFDYGGNEVQLIDCQCSRCTGGMYLSFNGQQTTLIPYDAGEEVVQFILSRLTTIGTFSVNFLQGTQLCSSVGSITAITFQVPQGPQPALVMSTLSLRGLLIGIRINGDNSRINPIYSSVRGSKKYVECSNRGTCDYSTGTCSCYGGWRSSDGLGGPGSRGDCGFRFAKSWNYTHYYSQVVYNNVTNLNVTVTNNTVVRTSCPFVNNDICSGNGYCITATGQCSCYSGYSGSACANMSCSSTNTWFGNALVSHTSSSVCGGIGECNGDTGKCINCGGNWGVFYGDQCQYLSCFTDGYGRSCSDNGVCLSLREIAKLTYNDNKQLAGITYNNPWDADLIKGCLCYRAISVDNQYHTDYNNQIIDQHNYNHTLMNDTLLYTDNDIIKFYRGPYAYTATDFKSYNCINSLCPKGDNPRTTTANNTNEVQMIICRADNGTFTLTFRGNTTLPIPTNATMSLLQYRLEQLYTISIVSVTYTGTVNSVCAINGNVIVYVEFLTEFGDLPLMTANTKNIMNINTIGFVYNPMNITEYIKGTKEDIECSGQGICNESKGVCKCFEGFSSSNGTIYGPGQKGDCSFYNTFYTYS